MLLKMFEDVPTISKHCQRFWKIEKDSPGVSRLVASFVTPVFRIRIEFMHDFVWLGTIISPGAG